MTDEKLKKATELSSAIKDLSEELGIWKESDGFAKGYIEVRCKNSAYCGYVNNSQTEFEVLKSLMISKLQKRLNELQKEYDEL